ncbi:MAG: glutaredoxin family protein [Gammaproteobacteria bacterium]|nr:glutaredoxin family protein [Gammaproteobacteria bacterium]
MRSLFPAAMAALLACASAAVLARTVVECIDADGNTSFRDSCPPGTSKKGEKDLGGVGPHTDPALGAAAVAYPIVLYAIPECDACDVLRHSLRSRGLPFKEYDVTDDPARQTELQDLTGGATVPTVVVGDNVISGYNRDALDAALQEAGYPLTAAGNVAQDGAAAPPR